MNGVCPACESDHVFLRLSCEFDPVSAGLVPPRGVIPVSFLITYYRCLDCGAHFSNQSDARLRFLDVEEEMN